MYQEAQMDGLAGRKKKGGFKGKFKKLLALNPLIPLPAQKKLMGKKKRPAATASPAPIVEPTYYQEPLPSPAPEPMMYDDPEPIRYTRPVPMPAPGGYSTMPVKRPYYEPSARDIPAEYYAAPGVETEQPFYQPKPEPGDDYSTNNLPIVSANEFEASDDSEYGWMEGLSEGAAWGDIFTGAASELVARQRERRENKQRAAMTQYRSPVETGGMNMNNMLIPAALGLGGLFLFMRMKKRRG